VWTIVATNMQTTVTASNPVMNVKGTSTPVQVASSDFYVDPATGKLMARQPAAPNGTAGRRRLLQDGFAPAEASLQVSSADTFISSSGVTQLRVNPPDSVPSFTSRSTGTYSSDLGALSASSASRHLLQADGTNSSGASYVIPGSTFAPICDWSSLDFYTPGKGLDGVNARGRCFNTQYCTGSGKGECMSTLNTGCATYLRNGCRLDHFLMQTQITLLMAQSGNGDSSTSWPYQSTYTGGNGCQSWACPALRAFTPSYWTQTVYGIVYINTHGSGDRTNTTYGACYSDMFRFYFSADRTSYVDLCMSPTYFPIAMGGISGAGYNPPAYPLSCTNGSTLTGTTLTAGGVATTSSCTSSFNGKSYYSDAIGCVENCPGGPYMDYTNLKYDSILFDLPCRPGFKSITIKYGPTFTVLSYRCIVMLDSIAGNDNDPNFGFFRQFNNFNDGCSGCQGTMICDPQKRNDMNVPAGSVGVPCSTLSLTATTAGAGRRLLALPPFTIGKTWTTAKPTLCGAATDPYTKPWLGTTVDNITTFKTPSLSVGVLYSGVVCLQPGDVAAVSGGSVAATQSTSSDARLKTNLQTTGGSIGKLAEYSWEWNELAKSLGVDSPTVGVIAQEAQLIYPAAVSKNPATGYLQVDYALLRELAQKDA
jgi:Chaperone of endosialidase